MASVFRRYRPVLQTLDIKSEKVQDLLVTNRFAYLPNCTVIETMYDGFLIKVMDNWGMLLTLRNDKFDIVPDEGDMISCMVRVAHDAKYGVSCTIIPSSGNIIKDTDSQLDSLLLILGLDKPVEKHELSILFKRYGLAANTILNTFVSSKDFLHWEKTGKVRNSKIIIGKVNNPREIALQKVWKSWKTLTDVETYVGKIKTLFAIENDRSLSNLASVFNVNACRGHPIFDLIKMDPYILYDLLPKSFPLRMCEIFASKVGIDSSHPFLLIRKMKNVLRDEENMGNCFTNFEFLLSIFVGSERDTALSILNGELALKEYLGPMTISVPTQIGKLETDDMNIDVSLSTMQKNVGNIVNWVHVDKSGKEPRVYRVETWKLQEDYLNFLRTAMKQPIYTPDMSTVNECIEVFEREEGFSLTEDQRHVVCEAARHPLLTICGDAGSGKTTTLKVVLFVLSKLYGFEDKSVDDKEQSNFICLAPTGKAARVFSQKTGYTARTIDSFMYSLKNSPPFCSNPILVIDEMSMVSLRHTRCIFALATLTKIRHVIFIGDISQLGAIGPGDVFHDTIQIIKECCKHRDDLGCKVVNLSGCQRTDDTSSAIYLNARKLRSERKRRGVEDSRVLKFKKLNQGELMLVDGVFEIEETEKVKEKVMEWVEVELKKDHSSRRLFESLQFMTSTNRVRKEINRMVQTRIQEEYHSYAKINIQADEKAFLNDKVMVCENDNELGIVNGDIGWIRDIDEESGKVSLHFEDGRHPIYIHPSKIKLTLAYCITVHKSQGSEFPFAICIFMQYHKYLTRSLMYTGLTRGQKMVQVIGSPGVFSNCINSKDFERESDAFRLYFYFSPSLDMKT